MNKKDIKYYSIIAAVLILTIVLEITKPKPIDWRFNLESEKKTPYGTYILFNTIKDLFSNQVITINKRTIYEFDKNSKIKNKNFIFIAEHFSADELETKTILDLIKAGNNVFISAHYFSANFSDTLDFSTDNSAFFDTTSNLNFYNQKLKKEKPYFFGKTAANYFFNHFDIINCQVLGFSNDNRPTLIKQSFGTGLLFLNTTPEVFTNYAMVTERNYDYAYKALSYLPEKEIVWDEHYKPFRKYNKTELSVIFDNPSLKIAYILLLVTTLIFVFFTIKRKQRIIPIIIPFQNKTLEFVETIGRVYFRSKNHKDIAKKKYRYFYSYLMNKYNIILPENESFDYKKIAEKTGRNLETVKKVLLTHVKINKLDKISADQLNTFNNSIEDFYDNKK